LGNLDERGVVHREDQDLLDIYEERCPLYEKYADITVELDGKNISETVDAMIEQLDKF
jgi:shikimate kinase